MKIFASIAYLLAIPLSLSAQDLSSFYFSFGKTYSDLGKLNAASPTLVEGQEGAPFNPDSERWTIGFGSRVGNWKNRLGFYWEGSSNKNEQNAISTQLREGLFLMDYSRGLFQVGKERRTIVGPAVGLGFENSKYILRVSEPSYEWDDILNFPGRSTTLSRTSLLLDLSLLVDFVIKAESVTEEYGFGIVLKGGYRLAPWSSKWKTDLEGFDSNEISGAPDFTLLGPYMNVSVAF